MMSLPIRITRVHPDAELPAYKTPGAVAFDLPLVEDLVIPARSAAKGRTGLVVKIPEGYGLFLFARSSTFDKTGLMLANSVGVIDQDFCGATDEVRVNYWNATNEEIRLPKGTRLAQGAFLPILRATWEEGEANEAARGGFGTTGA